MNTRTIFDHIPKTAGTSVKEAIAAAIGERGELTDVCYPHHIAVAKAGERRFVGSHLWFFPGEKLASDWHYSTMLRDPLDRFLSLYYFHRQHRNQVEDGTMIDPVVITAVRKDMDAYLADELPDVKRSYTNFQAYHFASRVCDRPDELNDSQLLDAAIASMEEYDLVGVFGDTQGFVDQYCHDLGLPQQTLPQLNVTRDRKFHHDFAPALIDKLRSNNAVDYALYGWAKSRFSQHRRTGASSVAVRKRESADAAGQLSFGTRDIEILSAFCAGGESGVGTVSAGGKMDIRIACRARVSEPDLTAGIAIRNAAGDSVCGINSRMLNQTLSVPGTQIFTLGISFDALLPAGDYWLTVALHKGLSHLDGCYHWLENAVRFTVQPGAYEGDIHATVKMAKHP
jgi:hypothetical protein